MLPRPGGPSLEPTERALPSRLGDFEIVELLGQGGSGVVYAARYGEQEVALKVLRADEMPTPRERERFVTEAQHMARIRHPNVVRILSVGELADGRPFLAMERLHGTNLAQRIARGPLPLPLALELFEQLASSVAAMHAAGLIHRDLKAENVMLVDGESRVVLLDFGIARPTDAPPSTTTRAGLQRGTPAVMAPERFFGARATLRSDIYELAVVLFAMMTGGLPWRDPLDPKARLQPLSPSQVGLPLPLALEQALMRAMSATVEERPASVAEFAGDIRRAMNAPIPAIGQGATQPDQVDSARLALAPTVASTTAPMGARRLPILGVLVAGLAITGGVIALVLAQGGDAEHTSANLPMPAEPEVSSLPSGADHQPGVGFAVDAGLAPGGGVTADAATDSPHRVARTAPGGDRNGETSPPNPGHITPAEVAAKPNRPRATPPPPTSPTVTPTPAAGGNTNVPWCRKMADLYCTPEFKATEGTMAGALCKNMQEQVAKWEQLPPDGVIAVESGCQTNFPQLEAAVKERLRLSKKVEQNDSQPSP